MSMTPLKRMLDISTIYHEPDVGFHRRVRYAFEDLSPGRDEVRRERRRQSRAQPQRNPDPKAGCSMSVNVDELGPVDWIVVEFPGTKMTGEIAPILKEYVDRAWSGCWTCCS